MLEKKLEFASFCPCFYHILKVMDEATNKHAISIHTVAGKMQNTLASAGTTAPVYLKNLKITVIDLWICKISMCILLAFQIRSKLRKNR